jgi:hypothetical protein
MGIHLQLLSILLKAPTFTADVKMCGSVPPLSHMHSQRGLQLIKAPPSLYVDFTLFIGHEGP